MNFAEIIQKLQQDTYGAGVAGLGSIGLFLPELILCATIVLLLLVRLFGCDRVFPPYWTTLLGGLAAFVVAYVQFYYTSRGFVGDTEFLAPLAKLLCATTEAVDGRAVSTNLELFTGLLVYDKLTVALRLYLLLFLTLVIALTVLSGIPDNEDGPDFYTLLLGSTIGMLLMVSANHLLILFLGIEMTSVPSYAMVGFLKGRRKSSEAAFKYVVFGAGAAGVMLYGLSLIGGLLGTLEFPLLAERINELFSDGGASLGSPEAITLMLAIVMVLAGIGFKLSLVPFHFWCPDAFEGAAAEVGGFLSVASKAAAFALLVRLCLAITGTPGAADAEAFRTLGLYVGLGLGAVAAVTTTFGNLAAYAQTNVKRLLAYSTIAHAGYMLMAVSAMMVLLNPPEGAPQVERAEAAIEGLLYYAAVYLFMNLGAFAVVAFIRNEIYSEEIDDYDGLATQCPILCVGMLVCMFSLVGMPPFGGFWGKLEVFASLFDAGRLHWFLWLVLVVGGLNTVFSLFYYLRVLKAMFIAERPVNAREARVRVNSLPGLYVLMVSVPVLVLGVFIGPLAATARSIAQGLLAALAHTH